MTDPEQMQIPPIVRLAPGVDMSDGVGNTDAIVDAIAKAVIERLSVSADGYRAAQHWIEVAIDPKLAKRTLRALHDSLVAVDAAQRKLDADRVAYDEHVAKTNAELREREKTAGRIWQIAKVAESDMAARERAVKEKEHELGLDFVPPSDFKAIEGTTITRSPEPRPRPRPHTVNHGPDGQPFPPGSTITMSVPGGELPPPEADDNPQLGHVAEQSPPSRPRGRPRKHAPAQPSAE